MGNFTNNAITDVGRMLLADVQAGAVFVPTRIVIGSGSMTGGATAQGMTDVITPVKSLAINKKKRTPDGKCVFGGVYTNEEVTEPFYFRELALYAKAVYLNEDGSVKSEGAETLYSYGNAGSTADYMPAYSTSTVVEKQMDLVVWVGNDAQVDLTIESGIYITHYDFDAHASRHSIGGEDPITPESIGAAPAGLVSGIYSAQTDEEFDNTIDSVFGSMSDNTSRFITVAIHGGNFMGHWTVEVNRGNATSGSAIAWCYGDTIQKAFFGGVWKPWEYINPPLLPGVEYRTAERRGSIVVYKKLDTDGLLKYRLEGETVWKSYAQENGAAPAGFGLGGLANMLRAADLNNITANGWYSWTIDSTNIPFDSGSMLVITRGEGTGDQYSYQIAFYDGTYDTVVKIRKKTLGTWGEWKNWSPDAFAPAGFGLGEANAVNWSDVDNLVNNGWYIFEADTTISGVYFRYSHMRVDAWNQENLRQTLYPILSGNPVLRRQKYGSEWQEWEWENPPLNVGVEYRTTDRYKGLAVYKMVDTAGNILWRAENETSWHLLSSANYVLPATVE